MPGVGAADGGKVRNMRCATNFIIRALFRPPDNSCFSFSISGFFFLVFTAEGSRLSAVDLY